MAFDQTFAYSKTPVVRSAAFPAGAVSWMPLLEVVLVNKPKQLRAVALLDSGSAYTIFSSQFADGLGINWRAAPTAPVFGVGGSRKD